MSMAITTVYVTTVTGGSAVFAQMAALSARSLRLAEPEVRISVLTDAAVPSTLQALFPPDVDFITVLGIPYDNPVARSRYIKTSVAQHVSAPFLFIDSDTLVTSPFLHKLARSRCDIMASYNRHRGFPAHTPWDSWTRGIFDIEQTAFPPTCHYNAGVIFCRTQETAEKFYARWHTVWRRQFEQLGLVRDQPCFNLSIAAGNVRCSSMPIKYNACIGASPSFARCAAIWHFTGGGKGSSGRDNTLLGRLLAKTENAGAEFEFDELLRNEIQTARDNYEPGNFVPNPDDYGALHYYNGIRKALRVRDYEAFIYLFKEHLRMNCLTKNTVKLIMKHIPVSLAKGLLERRKRAAS